MEGSEDAQSQKAESVKDGDLNHAVVFIRDSQDIDAIFAMFPGPVAISVGPRWIAPRSRLGCGLVSVVLLAYPALVILINSFSVGNWRAELWGLAILSFCLAFLWLLITRRYVVLVLNQDGFVVRNVILDQDRFVIKNGSIWQSCRWVDVSDFRLAGIIRYPRIRFKNSSRSARVRVILGLGEDWLPLLIYPYDGALADLMNRWRERVLQTNGWTSGPLWSSGLGRMAARQNAFPPQ